MTGNEIGVLAVAIIAVFVMGFLRTRSLVKKAENFGRGKGGKADD